MTSSWTDHLFLKLVNVFAFLTFFGSSLYSVVAPHHAGGKDTYLTPSNWTFGIWSLINLLLAGYVVYQFFDHSHDAIHGVGWRFAAIGLLNSVFLHLFVRAHYVVAFVFAFLVFSSVSTVYYSLKTHYTARTTSDFLFVHLPFSLYHAFSLYLLLLSLLTAFTHSPSAHPSIITFLLTLFSLWLLALTAWGYALSTKQGDLAGAAVLTWCLTGVVTHLKAHGQTGKREEIIFWAAVVALGFAGTGTFKALAFTVADPAGAIVLVENDGATATERTALIV